MPDLKIKELADGVEFGVKVTPGSSRTQIVGVYDGMLKIKVSAAPEKGRANKELAAFLAKKLKVKKNDIVIVSGKTNTVKTLQVACSCQKASSLPNEV